MPIHHARRPRRTVPRYPFLFLFLLGFAVLLLAPVMDTIGAAQTLPIQAQPTATPTEEFDPPLQVRTTATSTPRVTEEPEVPDEIPDDVQANPTTVPVTETVVDDIAPNPEPATLTLNKGVCDDSTFDPYTATGQDAFQDACFSPDGEFEFTVSDGGGFSETATTSLGSVQFTVPAGNLTISETIPEGFGDPAVFCWSDLLPTPAVQPFIGNGPSWDVTDSEQVECWWLNVSEDGAPDDLTTTDTQEGNSGNTVTVIAHRCPMGVVDDAEFDDYQVICTQEHDDIEFALDHSGGTFPGTTAGGEVQWTDVPPGNFAIQETVPAGFLDPLVWCGWNPSIELPALVPSAGGLVTGSFEDDASEYVCHWFNIPDPDANNSIAVVTKECPAGYPTGSNDVNDFHADCPSEHDGVEFTLTAPHGEFAQSTSGGAVEWTVVPVGDFSIQETIPKGYSAPVVFCNFGDDYQGGPVVRMPAEGGLVAAAIEEPNVDYYCFWFNIPNTGSSLVVQAWTCPAAFNEHVEDASETCNDATHDVTFSLTDDDPASSDLTAMTNNNKPSKALFASIAPGDYGLSGDMPEGMVRAFTGDCKAGGQSLPRLVSGDASPVMEFGIADGSWVVCDWYYVPEGGHESRVVVHKRICPEGADVVQTDDNTINDITTTCAEEGDGIEFTLDNADGSSTQAIVDGATWWDEVPPGPFTVTEQIPAGYGETVWYCITNVYDEAGDLQTDVTWEPVAAPGGGLSESIDEPYGEIFSCWVFNVRGEDGDNSITIRKWICSEGAGHDENQDWYEDNCVQQHDGVEFKVASDIGIAVMETAGASVQFDGLPSGTAGIQETIPEGFEAPVVFCATDAGWVAYPAPTGHWEYEFGDDGLDQALACHVYNIPGEPGSVTLLKWTCPPGYDLNAAGADPKVDCTGATNGVEFQFGPSGAGEEAELQTTGDVIDGGVFFDDLEPDTYKAVELVPEGIGPVFVLECTGHIMGVLQPYPLQMGNVLEIDIDAGEHLTCRWYNVPEPDGGTIIVLKYTCTTETFVSEVDCEIEEDGKTFDLLHWNVDDGVWEAIDTQVTDGVGLIAWTELEAGDYGLDEQDGEWCHLTTLPVFGEGDFFYVYENEETIVSVYNCDGEPGKPGDTPEKYPNTGVPPTRGDGQLQP